LTFTWDFNTATLSLIVGQIVLLIVFLVRTSNTAKAAHALAVEAKKLASEAHDRISTLQSVLGLHREHVAREYADKNEIHEMEKRLSKAIDRLGERIDEALHRGHQT
jgi:hypothetical protein